MQTQTADAAVQTVSASVSAASTIGALISTISDVALQVLGVPLQVLLAAIAGAFGARSYMPPVPFLRGVTCSCGWSAIACFLTPLTQQVVGFIGWNMSNAALAGIAVCLAASGQVCGQAVVDELPAIIHKRMSKLGGKE